MMVYPLGKNAPKLWILQLSFQLNSDSRAAAVTSFGKNQKYRHSDRQRKGTEPSIKYEDTKQT